MSYKFFRLFEEQNIHMLLFNFVLGLRLFGESYSGLEYDYKGLCNVYEYLNDTGNKFFFYEFVLFLRKFLYLT